MPLTTGTYLCKICNEPFQARSDRYYSCPCGNSRIKPNKTNYKGYIYSYSHKVTPITGQTYYSPDDFISLSKEALNVLSKIKDIQKKSGYKYHMHEMKEVGENGESYLSAIVLSMEKCQRNSIGTNTIQLTINLCPVHYAVSKNIQTRLECFLEIMQKNEQHTIDVSSCSDMQILRDELDLEETKTPVEAYHYVYTL